jgi:hypothetical protein
MTIELHHQSESAKHEEELQKRRLRRLRSAYIDLEESRIEKEIDVNHKEQMTVSERIASKPHESEDKDPVLSPDLVKPLSRESRERIIDFLALRKETKGLRSDQIPEALVAYDRANQRPKTFTESELKMIVDVGRLPLKQALENRDQKIKSQSEDNAALCKLAEKLMDLFPKDKRPPFEQELSEFLKLFSGHSNPEKQSSSSNNPNPAPKSQRGILSIRPNKNSGRNGRMIRSRVLAKHL